MKISFDFDSCLSESYVQVIAKSLINMYHDVYIITSRNSNINNKDLFDICTNIGLPEYKVIFTDGNPKFKIFFDNNFKLHFDDDWEEVMNINNKGGNAILIKPDFEDIFSEMQYRQNNETS